MHNPQLRLSAFDPAAAAMVARWVRSPQELEWLSPETRPPLTAEQVIAWGTGVGRRQFTFHLGSDHTAAAYAELNDMPTRPDHKWIGHLLVDPARRGRALGLACTRALLAKAFEELAASEVILVVAPGNDAAIRCYRRAGLVETGQEVKHAAHLAAPYRLIRMSLTHGRYAALGAGVDALGERRR